MKIYPKISIQETSNEMKEIIKKSEGVELQFFDEKDITEEFNFENLIRKIKIEFGLKL